MAPRQLPRALRRPLLKPKQAEAMRQAVRQIDELIILAAMPDLFERVAFPQRVREQMVATMWNEPQSTRQSQSGRPVDSAGRVATAAPGERRRRQRRRRRLSSAEASTDGETSWRAHSPRQSQPIGGQQVMPSGRRTLREMLPTSTLRRLTLVAAISQWRLVVAQCARHIRILAQTLGTCRARVFREWRHVTISLCSNRRAVGFATSSETVATESAAAVERTARAGTWPRLLGEVQTRRRTQRSLQRWRKLEALAVIRGWSVLAFRGRMLRRWSWVLKHSLVLRRCLYAWEQWVLGSGLDETTAETVAVASAAPFIQRLVQPAKST